MRSVVLVALLAIVPGVFIWAESNTGSQDMGSAGGYRMVWVTADAWCDPCTWFQENTLASPQVLSAMSAGPGQQGWTVVKVLDTDPATLDWDIQRLPTVLYLDPEGREMGRSVGAVTADTVIAQIQRIAPQDLQPYGDPQQRSLSYRINNGRIWDSGEGFWYTQDAGLPARLEEYDRDDAFLYLRDAATATVLALTVNVDAEQSLWRWDVTVQRWVDVGLLIQE